MDEEKIDSKKKLIEEFIKAYETVIEKDDASMIQLCETVIIGKQELDRLIYSYYCFNSDSDSFSKFTYMKQMELIIKGKLPNMVSFVKKVNSKHKTNMFGAESDELTALMS